MLGPLIKSCCHEWPDKESFAYGVHLLLEQGLQVFEQAHMPSCTL